MNLNYWSFLVMVYTQYGAETFKAIENLPQITAIASRKGEKPIPHPCRAPRHAFAETAEFGPPARISVPSSPNLKGSSPNLSEKRDDNGYLIADSLALPIIHDIAALAPSLRGFLEKIAAVPRTKGKVDREVLIAVVLQLCARHFVTLRCLALLVNRKPETLRDQYLTKLVRERKLTLAFPKTPTHEQQAYAAAEAT